MPDHRSRALRSVRLALALSAAFILTACVASRTRLLTGSDLLGDQFRLNLYQEFADGKAVNRKTAVFRWSGERYEITSGEVGGLKSFRVEPRGKNDLLVEATDDKAYAYFLARKIAEATYRFVPVNEHNLGQALQRRFCVMQDQHTCTIETRPQLDAFVRASIGKAGPLAMVVVISTPPAEGAAETKSK
jgi:hypothetical protein